MNIDEPESIESIDEPESIESIDEPESIESIDEPESIESIESIDELEEKPSKKVIPDKLIIKRSGDDYYITGRPLANKKIVKDLFIILGEDGKYATLGSGGKKVEDKNVIKFRKDALVYNRNILLKLGAEYPYSQGRVNRNVLEVRGEKLRTNRERLEGLGGKYPVSIKGRIITVDTSRIKFPREYEDRIKDYIFTTLHPDERFLISYGDWIKHKARMFLDTAIQLSKIQNQKRLGRKVIDFTIKNIYRCDLSIRAIHTKGLNVDYEEIISEVMNQFSDQDEYSGYNISGPAKKKFAQYLEQLGELLVEPLKIEDKTSAKTYEDYLNRLNDIEEWTDSHFYCSAKNKFTPDQICIIRALQHIASCIMQFTDLNDMSSYNKKLAYLAFMVLLPGNLRKNGKEFVNTVYMTYQIDMDEESITETLKKFGIRYNINDIYSSLVDSHYDCGNFCPDEQKCEGAMVIFATALGYLDPFIENPKNQTLRHRIRALAVLKPQTQSRIFRYKEDSDSEIEFSYSEEESEDETEEGKKYTHRELDIKDKRLAVYKLLLGDVENQDQYNSIVRKLEAMNDTLRLRALNKLSSIPLDEKIKYIGNIKNMAVYLKEDINTLPKRHKIYALLILPEVDFEDYDDVVYKIEDLEDSARLKLLNKWYNSDPYNRREAIHKMLQD